MRGDRPPPPNHGDGGGQQDKGTWWTERNWNRDVQRPAEPRERDPHRDDMQNANDGDDRGRRSPKNGGSSWERVGDDVNAKGEHTGELYKVNRSANGFLKCSTVGNGKDVFIHKSIIEKAKMQIGTVIRFDVATYYQGIPQCGTTVFLKK